MFSVGQKLSKVSSDDKPWAIHKNQNFLIGSLYAALGLDRYAERMSECSEYLIFGEKKVESHDHKLKLLKSSFCRVRYCPICAWRKSMAYKARFYKNLPNYVEKIRDMKFIYAVFTIKNCEMSELRDKILHMNYSMKNLLKRKEFSFVNGYIKTIEVTKGKDGKPHPHVNMIIAVNKSYFTSRDYLKHGKWQEIWGDCLGIDYLPIVHVKKVRKKKKTPKIEGVDNELIGALVEVVKYGVKPSDLEDDPNFLYGITQQTHALHFLSSGGVFSGIFRKDRLTTKEDADDVSDNELIGRNEDNHEKITNKRLHFSYYIKGKDYILTRIYEDNSSDHDTS